MLNKKLGSIGKSESKLSKTINQIAEGGELEKSGFVKYSKKTSLYKTKSFRLRDEDLTNLANIISHVNNNTTRKIYSDSQVIRGIINYLSNNIDSNLKKIIPYIQNSS